VAVFVPQQCIKWTSVDICIG